MKKPNPVADRIKQSARTARRADTKIDKWLKANPKHRHSLDETAKSFAKYRNHNFGWRQLSAILQDELDGFPAGEQTLSRWFTLNYPELFSNGNK